LDWTELIEVALKILIVFGVVMGTVAYMSLAERRFSAFIQDRYGPNRVGPFGLFQPIADGIKFLFKEDIIPEHAHKFFYILAPMMCLGTALVTFAVIPFGETITLFGREIKLVVTDVNIGILYVIAIASLGIYGIVYAGWSSNNKYSLLGGLRSSAQMISYELALTLAVVGVVMRAGSFRIQDIVASQASGNVPLWNCVLMPIGFVVFIVSAFAETNRLPFDLPEAEPELVAGYHTEYSSLKFAMFYMAEYANMITSSALIVLLFFGGWHLPWLSSIGHPFWQGFFQVGIFAAKVAFFLFLYIWVRWTLPRFRYDQLMSLGWKVLFPLSLINICLVSFLIMVEKWFASS
jgi:NADH-quinone oxidoreductase subunit H